MLKIAFSDSSSRIPLALSFVYGCWVGLETQNGDLMQSAVAKKAVKHCAH
jgi:hypothetical protein